MSSAPAAQDAVPKSGSATDEPKTAVAKEDGQHTKGWVVRLKHALQRLLPEELRTARNAAQYLPLIAAIAAPMSTLMDVPALSQHWYSYNDVAQRDPTVNLCLSAVGLFFNVLANVLLLIRFAATKQKFWRWGVKLSLLCWIMKTTIALVNLLVFGAGQRNGPGYHYDQGFWCAVVSCIISGCISFCLLAHYVLVFEKPEYDLEDLRLEGRKFMLSVTAFIGLIGLQGMVFNFIENWGYLNAVYFSVQTALTVGYGDYTPTKAVGKVLIFPFAVLTISLLANEVSTIIDFIQNRAQNKRDKWRKQYAVAMHKEALERQPYATLIDEMSLIHQINLHQETMVQLYDLAWSAFALCAFWLIGAVIFHFLEGWGYGNTLYALVITCLTIGFGDFTPVTDAGRVVWIVYALMAVPIVTSFAVQTVTGILYTWYEHRFTKARFNMVRQRDPEVFAPHSHFVLKMHAKWDKVRRKYMRKYGPSNVVPNLVANGYYQDVLQDAKVPAQVVNEAVASSPVKATGGFANDREGSPVESQRRLLGSSVDGEKDSAEGGEQNTESAAEKKAQDTVVDDMLEDPDTRADVVEALGGEDLAGDAASPGDAGGDNSDTDGSSVSMPAASESSRPSSAASAAASTASDDDKVEVLDNTSEPDNTTGAGTKVAGGPVERSSKRPIQNVSRPPPGPTQLSPFASVLPTPVDDPTATTPSTLATVGSKIAKHDAKVIAHAEQERAAGEAADEAAGAPAPPADGICAPARDKGDTSMEYQLIKSLVDRVTRLEAQARQMLIDSMDKDLSRTLLLADRNLQVRDAFRLYDVGVDVEQTYKQEAEKARKEAEEAKMDAGDDDGQDDMLSRVRRYRATFAEILVISSTLLRLEGEDLKQFERWHVGDLHHHKREADLHARGAEGQKGVKGAQQKAVKWAKEKRDHTTRVRDILLGSKRRDTKPLDHGPMAPQRPSSRASPHRRRQGGAQQRQRRSTVGCLVSDSESGGDDAERHDDPYDAPGSSPQPTPPIPGGPPKAAIRTTVHPSLNLRIPVRTNDKTVASPTAASADTPTDYNEYNTPPAAGRHHSFIQEHRKQRIHRIFTHNADGVFENAQKESKAITSRLTEPTKKMAATDAIVVHHAAENVFKEIFLTPSAKRNEEIGREDDARDAAMDEEDAQEGDRLQEEDDQGYGWKAKAPPRAPSSTAAGGSSSKPPTGASGPPQSGASGSKPQAGAKPQPSSSKS